MIRYSRYIEPDVPQQRAVPKSPSPKPRTVVVPPVQAATVSAPTSLKTDIPQRAVETLLTGVEQLELTALDSPPSKGKKGKPAPRKPKMPPVDSTTAPALPLLTQFEI
jgi:hypothetical protein